jgi:hypothetical protein
MATWVAAAIVVVMLAVLLVQASVAKLAMDRARRMVDIAVDGREDKVPMPLVSCVRSYSIVVDLAATYAVAGSMAANKAGASGSDSATKGGGAMNTSPPPQWDTGTFMCAGVLQALPGTYLVGAWAAIRPTADASQLFDDLAAARVRYLYMAGAVVRAWVWVSGTADAGRGGIRWYAPGGEAFPSEAASRWGNEMPLSVPPGTIVLVLAQPESMQVDAAGMPSTIQCADRRAAPIAYPLGPPRGSWEALASSLSASRGNLAMHAWGFGGRLTTD